MYRYTRLPFGIASAPAIFQKAMDSILQGLQHVICYLDDILVTETTEEEHLQNLDAVFRRLKENGMRMKKDKCHIWQSSVVYLGHHVEVGQRVFSVPTGAEGTCTSSSSPMVVARQAMGLGTFGFCRSLHGTHLSH